jgi:hypothetical protein
MARLKQWNRMHGFKICWIQTRWRKLLVTHGRVFRVRWTQPTTSSSRSSETPPRPTSTHQGSSQNVWGLARSGFVQLDSLARIFRCALTLGGVATLGDSPRRSVGLGGGRLASRPPCIHRARGLARHVYCPHFIAKFLYTLSHTSCPCYTQLTLISARRLTWAA